jgi:PAS domain S-box-containing protein
MAFFVVVGLTAFTYYGMMHTYDSLHRENNSLTVLREAEALYQDIRDLRKLATGYLLLGDTSHSQTYQQLYGHSLNAIAMLKSVENANPGQKGQIDRLLQLHSKYVAAVHSLLQLPYSKQITPEVEAGIKQLHTLLAEIEPIVFTIENAERAQLKEAEVKLKAREHRTMAVFVATSASMFLLMLLSFILVRMLVSRIQKGNRQLIESRETFSKLFYRGPFMYALLKPGTPVIDKVNDRALEYLGLREKDLEGKSIEDLQLVSNEQQKEQINRQILNGASLQNVELPVTDASGNTKWISFHSVEVILNGQATMLLGGIDITARKVAEEKLKYMNDVLERRVMERTAELSDYKFALDEAAVVSVTDTKGNIKYVNDNFVKLTGYTRQEAIGSNARMLNSGYHKREYFRSMWQTITSGSVWRGEFCNKAKDGSLYWVDTTIVPFINEKGKVYQYLAIRYNITARKQAEAELMALNESLEEKVKDRTLQLEEANRMLESFSYSVSHDLRAPVRNMSSLVQLLQKNLGNNISKQQEELVHHIKDEADKMNMLIDDLLEFARADRKTLDTEAVDMNQLVQGTVAAINNSIPHKAQFVIEKLPMVKGDKALLRQVWVNLISNAVKYSAKKENPTVKIWADNRGKEAVFHVQDNGAGFDMKASDKLFGVFQRLHSSTEFEGTGVGLSIVKRVIQKHNGNITAQAEPGRGAEFTFTLPAA